MGSRHARIMKLGIPVLAFCAGLGMTHVPGLLLSSPAWAATTFSPLDKLLAEDEIRNKIAIYGLYADGDGTGGQPKNMRALADTLLTPDVVSEIYPAAGGPPKVFTGRDILTRAAPMVDPAKVQAIAGRHYLVSTVFDDISPTEAHTRTAAVYFDATKSSVGPPCAKAGETGCGGAPVKTMMWVYHMSWTKMPDGWRISKTILRDDN